MKTYFAYLNEHYTFKIFVLVRILRCSATNEIMIRI